MLAFSLIPDSITDVGLFLAVGTLSVFLVSLGKAGFGGGLGLVSIPLLVLACGWRSQLALGIMLPLLILNDYVALAAWLGRWRWRPVLLMLPGMIAGIALGGLAIWAFRRLGDPADAEVTKRVTDAAVMLAIGLIAIGFVALRVLRSLRGEVLTFRPVLWQGAGVGAAAGFTSTLAHAAGPMVQMYMLAQRMPKERFVATTILYFWIGNQLKLVPYAMLGMLNPDSLRGSACFVPAILAGTAAGIWLHRRVGDRQFTVAVHVLILASGAAMVVKSLQVLLA